jgi:pilus assembly protein CpaB
MLTADLVQLVAWPEANPVPGAFTTVEDVVGRGIIAPLVQNEPVTENKLAPREAGAGLPASIPAGMRAMSVRVNDVIGVAGFVVPNTRVDVLVTLRGDNSVSRIVLNNIQVLAAGTRTDIEQSRDGKPIPTNVVTLALTPAEAERLALAEDQGTIALALRNPMDVVPVETRGVRVGALLGAPEAPPTRRVVQGQVRVVAPPPPPQPYRVESIRGAKRAEETID